MLFVNIKRIIKSGVANFWRSRMVSISAILVVFATLSVFSFLLFSNAALNSVLNQIKNKVDINVYFSLSAPENDILELKTSLEKIPEVASVEYISREDALKQFKERHTNDQLTLQALEELGDNPLGAVLNIHAKETSQYESIANFLNHESALSADGSPIIDKVNYYQNKLVIERLTKIIDATEKIGLTLSLILIILSVIITFNTIRLIIYISREEISVMRLVGASHKYVRGPFIVSGIIYGAVSAFFALVLSLVISVWVESFSQKIFGMSMLGYFADNFFKIFFILLGSGIILGSASSYLAVRKYLKV